MKVTAPDPPVRGRLVFLRQPKAFLSAPPGKGPFVALAQESN